jgi:GntR family transcriptional regulator
VFISIDLNDPEPIYEQIVGAIKDLINRGDLKIADALPTVRQLAQDLGVNLNTVARAYRELAALGVLNVRQGRGVSVVSAKGRYGSEEQQTVRKRLKRLGNKAVFMGVQPNALHAMIDSELNIIKEAWA